MKRPAFRCLLASASALLFLGPASHAADSDLESRLNALEARLASLESENHHLRSRLGEASAAFAHARPDGMRSLKVSGYSQIHAEFGGSPDARWNGTQDRIFVRRADISLSADVGHGVSFKVESELSGGSLAQNAGHTPTLTDAYVTWAMENGLSLRAGQFKSPYGRAQLASNTIQPLVERPLASDRLTVGRQIGVALSGDLNDSFPFNYTVGVFNGTGGNASFTTNSQFMTAARVVVQMLEHQGNTWELAANGFHYDPGTPGTDRRVGWGVDTAFKTGAFLTEAEYLRSDYEGPGRSRSADGWWIGSTWSPNPVWQAVVRYGTYDPSSLLPTDDTTLWTLGLNYLVHGDDLKLSLNYLLGDDSTGRDSRVLSRLQVKF